MDEKSKHTWDILIKFSNSCENSETAMIYSPLSDLSQLSQFPAGNCMLKVNNRNTRKRCEIRSKLTIKTTERRQWRRSGVFIVNFEHISHLAPVFLLLTLSR